MMVMVVVSSMDALSGWREYPPRGHTRWSDNGPIKNNNHFLSAQLNASVDWRISGAAIKGQLQRQKPKEKNKKPQRDLKRL